MLYDTIYDTLVEFYQYKNGFLDTKRKTEYGKIGVYQYVYDENGLVKKVNKGKEVNKSKSKIIHIPFKNSKISLKQTGTSLKNKKKKSRLMIFNKFLHVNN